MSDAQIEPVAREQSPFKFTLDFGNKATSKSNNRKVPRRKLIMGKKSIKTVTVEYHDGEVKTFHIPAEQGYYRERWTYEEEDHSKKIKNKLIIHEIFWVLREKYDPATMG